MQEEHPYHLSEVYAQKYKYAVKSIEQIEFIGG
jgi:hypothetical protein